MIVTITEVTEEFTKSGDQYMKVKGTTPDGRETTKSVFSNLSDFWPLLVKGATLDFSMQKKGQFWNVTEIKSVTEEKETKPKMAPGALTKTDNSASIELQVAYKGIIELAVADRLKMDSQLVRAALNWATSKLGYWASPIVEGKPMPEETREKIEKALEKEAPLNWQVVKPQVEKLMSGKKKGWETTAKILTVLKGLGATETKSIGAAYDSLLERGKQQFVDLVKAETPSRLIAEAEKLGAKEV